MKTSIMPRLGYRPDNKGRYALIIQVIRGRRRSIFTLPYRLLPGEFSRERGCAVSNSRQRKHSAFIGEVNACIGSALGEFCSIDDRFRKRGKFYTAREITSVYRLGHNNHTLLAFAHATASDLEARNRFGAARAYRSLASAWRKFSGQSCYGFRQLDSRTVGAFIGHLEQNGNKRNTIHFYARTLRALWRRACKCGYACPSRNPFGGISFGVAKTPKLAVGRQLLTTLACRDFGDALLNEARDMFLFSFYARGMSFVDMAYLRKENICGGVLYYERRKTHRLFRVAVTPRLRQIMERYNNPHSPWVLPCMERGARLSCIAGRGADGRTGLSPAEQYKSYCRALRFYLRLLREISGKTGMSGLTFNVARHTWATVARDMGVPMPHISEGLGHASEKTTRFYIAQLGNGVVDEINERVTKLF